MAIQDDVAAAQPQIDERTAQLVSKGRWNVPGYKVRLSKTTHSSGFYVSNAHCRRNSATSQSCRALAEHILDSILFLFCTWACCGYSTVI
jgi:hypothetical protein